MFENKTIKVISGELKGKQGLFKKIILQSNEAEIYQEDVPKEVTVGENLTNVVVKDTTICKIQIDDCLYNIPKTHFIFTNEKVKSSWGCVDSPVKVMD